MLTINWKYSKQISNENLHHKIVFYNVKLYAVLLISACQFGDLKTLGGGLTK